MKKKIILSRIFLGIGIASVLLTIIIPGLKISLGNVFSHSYNGFFSVIIFCISLGIFFKISSGIDDICINRMKFVLSCSFLLSLFTNILFL
ncbi:hypothetical protein C8E03_10444 [Lachnotalea glycerini]|jgi:hypothetical protein|uniref:Uncharacterized protein n=1 Tax=Lachnotalea glycerini TaxID=1763509 RepID=A0A255HZP7_9FIRM|nr:hypothetical protein C8E03_10444 [Lachnotalea glycerini]RDY28465.1 hypothetical protein CG710_019645 [Lachnotalea glycerini]